MEGQIAQRKHDLRARIRGDRLLKTPRERALAAQGLAEKMRLITGETNAVCVSCYLSSPSEPDTSEFLAWARTAELRVLLPITRPDRVLDWAQDDGSHRPTTFGVPETAGTALGSRAIDAADVLFIPAAAVGQDGVRLGWGKGYFDTMLGDMRKCAQVYAVLFDGELLDEVPREPHDRAVDGALTPSKIVRFG